MAPAVKANFPFLLSPAMPSAALHRYRLTPPYASARLPSKRAKRKNHLRPKILKTLTKPLTTVTLPEIAPAEITAPNPFPLSPVNDSVLDTPSEETEMPHGTLPADQFDKLSEFQASETINRAEVFSNISATSVLKFCVYLFGVVIVQTICTIWFLESTNSFKKEKKLIDLNGEGSALINGSNAEMEEKINEIRAMAKEARKREKLERQGDNEENDIEKEISTRLAKLEKKLSSKREKLPGSFMNYLGLFGTEEEEEENEVKDKNLELEEDKKNLIFRKKLRFRSPPMESRTNPKGFSGSSKTILNSSNGSGPNGLAGTERKAMDKQFNSSQTDPELRQEKLNLQKKPDSVSESSNSKKSETKLNQKAPKKPNGFAGKRPKAKVMEKKSVVKTDLWWLNRPYVLAILIRRGPEHESAGLYVLRAQNASSYTVAFEDRSDANNFCYLLESFFEDLGDFRADIVPLSTKDIHDEMKSGTKKIIVVKKGQIKLYAGQPFAEVEMALQSLI